MYKPFLFILFFSFSCHAQKKTPKATKNQLAEHPEKKKADLADEILKRKIETTLKNTPNNIRQSEF